MSSLSQMSPVVPCCPPAASSSQTNNPRCRCRPYAVPLTVYLFNPLDSLFPPPVQLCLEEKKKKTRRAEEWRGSFTERAAKKTICAKVDVNVPGTLLNEAKTNTACWKANLRCYVQTKTQM